MQLNKKGRGRKVVHKRAAARKKNYGDEDEDDEKYVPEEEESSYDSDIPDDESFDASEANNSASSAAAEEIPNAKLKSRRGFSSGRWRSNVSDYEELEDDNYEDDEDFSPDATDKEDWDEYSLLTGHIYSSARKGATKRGGKKLKRKVSKPKVNSRKRKAVSAPGRSKRRRTVETSDDEEEFIVKDRSVVNSSRKDSKKASKRKIKPRIPRRKRSSIHSDSSDSDFLTSDDDLSVKVGVAVDSSKNKKIANSGRRKKNSKVDSETSDSDFVVSEEDRLDNNRVGLGRSRNFSRPGRKNARSSRKHLLVESKRTDSNDEISENEVTDLENGRALKLGKHDEFSAGKKGKEKEADDLGKQFCGICLSEEHKGTIQGILNCCSHYFCFSCIMEWSKVESRCPICKRRFVTITKFSRSDPLLEMRRPVIRVQMRDQVYQPSEDELRVLLDPYEDVICMECHEGGDDSLMLLCDICDSSAHSFCVGLGRQVPEGNWYCECCKLAGDGPRVLDTRIGASSSHMTHAGLGVEEKNDSRNPQAFDLNLNPPPTNLLEDNGVAVSTVHGRRAIHRHIRIILSNNRAREVMMDSPPLHTASSSVVEHNAEIGRNFRHVEGAKKQVNFLVKACLQKLPEEVPLEDATFKYIERKATHTILAACGIQHRRRVVSSILHPPDRCSHDLDGGPVNFITGCCSSCFTSYVKDVVKMFVQTF